MRPRQCGALDAMSRREQLSASMSVGVSTSSFAVSEVARPPGAGREPGVSFSE